MDMSNTPKKSRRTPDLTLDDIRKEVKELHRRTGALHRRLAAVEPTGSYYDEIAGMDPDEAVGYLVDLLDSMRVSFDIWPGLTATESKIMTLLKRRSPNPVSFESLSAVACRDMAEGMTNPLLASHIKRIRKKGIGEAGGEIRTHYALGYSYHPVDKPDVG